MCVRVTVCATDGMNIIDIAADQSCSLLACSYTASGHTHCGVNASTKPGGVGGWHGGELVEVQ